MKSKEAIISKLIELGTIIKRYEKKGDFYRSNIFKRDVHILNWVLEDDEAD